MKSEKPIKALMDAIAERLEELSRLTGYLPAHLQCERDSLSGDLLFAAKLTPEDRRAVGHAAGPVPHVSAAPKCSLEEQARRLKEGTL